jgi:hypothetical protein
MRRIRDPLERKAAVAETKGEKAGIAGVGLDFEVNVSGLKDRVALEHGHSISYHMSHSIVDRKVKVFHMVYPLKVECTFDLFRQQYPARWPIVIVTWMTSR